jgi:oligopeptidase A
MQSSLGLPQFSSIQAEGYSARLDAMLKGHLEHIEQLLQENPHYTWDNLMYPLECMEDEVDRFWSPLSHLHSVVNSEVLRQCYEACLPLLSAYETAIGQNHGLYKAIQSIDKTTLDLTAQKIIRDSLQQFELSGVALTAAKKKRYEVIQMRLDELSNQFDNHILDAEAAFTLHITTPEGLMGIPEYAQLSAAELAEEKHMDGYLFNLEYPTFKAVLSYADDRALRETMYEAYVTRASDKGPHAGQFDNTSLIAETLALRDEQAKLLGFKNFATYSLATKMADSPQQVLEFIDDLITRARKQARIEIQELKEFAQKEHHIKELKPWDVGYFSEKRRKALYSLSQEDLRPYFPQSKVMEGLFSLVNTLFGMRVEELDGVDVWHKDVQCFCIIDETNSVRGIIYTDLYARPNKQGGAWMDSLQSRMKLQDGRIQLPIATLTCNFTKAAADKPAVLSHDELLTLFHEFGHCLQHVLTQVDYLGASGIAGVEWDAVELPSQFFENWCWGKHTLIQLSAHVDTGLPLPEALFDKLLESKNYQSAMAMLRQQEYALFDFCIHEQYDPMNECVIDDILAAVRAKTSLMPVMSYNRFQNSFSHIFGGGYAAGYYSYSWAEVLSSDAFSRFEEEGILNPKTGRAFLQCILETGGSQKAAEAYRAFRGRDATIDALLRHNGIKAS